MLEALKTNLLYPVLGRLGTMAASALVTSGVAQQHADAIGLGLTATALVGIDLISSWVRKQAIHNKVWMDVNRTLDGQ